MSKKDKHQVLFVVTYCLVSIALLITVPYLVLKAAISTTSTPKVNNGSVVKIITPAPTCTLAPVQETAVEEPEQQVSLNVNNIYAISITGNIVPFKKSETKDLILMAAEPVKITYKDLEINVDELMVYYSTTSLNKEREDFYLTCFNFLHKQAGVNETIVSAMIGNFCAEGYFGQRQTTHAQAKNYKEYIGWLDDKKAFGVGVAQWTSQNRQNKLKNTMNYVIEYLNKNYNYTLKELKSGNMWPTVVILSELYTVYFEMQDYKLFDYNKRYSLEDACGRIAVKYEGYAGSSSQWQKEKNSYRLVGGEGTSGAKRLDYTKSAYQFFKNTY